MAIFNSYVKLPGRVSPKIIPTAAGQPHGSPPSLGLLCCCYCERSQKQRWKQRHGAAKRPARPNGRLREENGCNEETGADRTDPQFSRFSGEDFLLVRFTLNGNFRE